MFVFRLKQRFVNVFRGIDLHGFHPVAKGKLSRYLSNFETSLRIFTVNETHPIIDKKLL